MSAVVILLPRTREELAEHVAAAARDRVPLLITGSDAAPLPVPPGGRVVSTRGLNRVIVHEPGDLTLTVEGGATVGEIQGVLEAHRQFLAFDRAASTIGGAIASGRDGPMASRFGRVRDQVLGLAVVNGDGRITRCGGRVVKNVTGYDLCRLYTGSRGGLGVVVEATVRVRPLPEAARRLDCASTDARRALACALLIRSRIPEVTALSLAGSPAGPVVLTVVVAGFAALVDAVDREVREIARELGPVSASEADVRSLDAGGPPTDARVVEIAAPPARWPEMLRDWNRLLPPPIRWEHDVLRGVRRSWHDPSAAAIPDDAALDAWLRGAGAAIDLPGEPAFGATLPSRFPSQSPGGLALMTKLKAALDPARILNPGMNVYG